MGRDGSPGETDEALVVRFQRDPDGHAGREAVALLLGRYVEGLHRWCSRFVSDPERVRDLVQDTLLAALRGLPDFKRDAKFRSWLFTIARNRCLNSYRDTRLVFVDEEALDRRDAGLPDPAQVAEWAGDTERLRRMFMIHLDPLERQALWLRCVDGVPVEAITRLLGIEQASGARGVLQAARRKLRAALTVREGGEPNA